LRFFIFISVFVTLYGLLHAYALLKVLRAFVLTRWVSIPLVCFMGFMVFCPILIRVLERLGVDALARLLAHMGYVWMGLLFLFVSASLALDLYHLVCAIGGRLMSVHAIRWFPGPRTAFYMALVFALLAAGYGYMEALNIRTQRVTIRTPKIPEEIGRIRIVQISDIHLGMIVGPWRLERILKKVREAKPDMLVSTGDLLDGQTNDTSQMVDAFRRIVAPYGKFAVTGNHEFYAGIDRCIGFMEDAGFVVLRGDTRDVRGLLRVAGVDDPAVHGRGTSRGVSERDLLSGLPRDRFVVLLKHRPYLDPGSEGLMDLQLSGHTHGGQIFPFSLIIQMLYPVHAGLKEFRKGAFLYVSRGSGTWGPPFRVWAPPEVTIIDLVH